MQTATTVTTDERQEAVALRYLKVLGAIVVVVTLVIVGVNLAAFAVMIRPENATIVQLTDGWGRLYKPILYDWAKPQVAAFGPSYTRDAFDPEEIEKLIGMSFFNFAVSGGAPYENRRFAQSASANANLKAIILSLDSFVPGAGKPKVSYGFDESILDVTADGAPTPFVKLHRAAAIALSGAAVGNNLQFLLVLGRIADGASKEEVLSSYQRRDNSRIADALVAARARVFPAVPPAAAAPALSLPGEVAASGLPEFDRAVDAYCDRSVDVYAYLTPFSLANCRMPLTVRLKAFAYLRTRQRSCRARFHFYDFQYPNAVTTEGMTHAVSSSLYYRPDGHPRPTIGDLMAPAMFAKPFPPATPAAVTSDFGEDLLADAHPLAWWAPRLARCDGRW